MITLIIIAVIYTFNDSYVLSQLSQRFSPRSSAKWNYDLNILKFKKVWNIDFYSFDNFKKNHKGIEIYNPDFKGHCFSVWTKCSILIKFQSVKISNL